MNSRPQTIEGRQFRFYMRFQLLWEKWADTQYGALILYNRTSQKSLYAFVYDKATAKLWRLVDLFEKREMKRERYDLTH